MATINLRMEKTLSIVIPMYNAEHFIEDCLDSILAQDLPESDYEVVIINDGSTDGSLLIANKYASEFPQINVLNQANAGQSVARNRGIEVSSGKFLCFVDADDFLFPNSLLPIYNLVKGNTPPPLQYAECQVVAYEIKGGGCQSYTHLKGDNKPINLSKVITGIEYIERYNYNNGPWYYFVRRDYLNAYHIRFVEGMLCEDGMFTLSVLINSTSIVHVDKDVYYYVNRPNSTTTTISPERKVKLIEGFNYAIDYITGIIDDFRNEMTDGCRLRILNRRDSYVFFLLMRLIRTGSIKDVNASINSLKSKNVYPLKYFCGTEYPGLKFKVLCAVVNAKYICLLCTFMLKMLKSLQ